MQLQKYPRNNTIAEHINIIIDGYLLICEDFKIIFETILKEVEKDYTFSSFTKKKKQITKNK